MLNKVHLNPDWKGHKSMNHGLLGGGVSTVDTASAGF